MKQTSNSVIPILLAFFLALFSGRGETVPKLTQEAIDDLEAELMDAEPNAAEELLKPHLPRPDPRLSSIIADYFAEAEDVPVEFQKELFDALMKIADKDAFEPIQKILYSEDIEMVRKAIRIIGKTRHPEAAVALITVYSTRPHKELHSDILIALGDNGDRSAIGFIRQRLKREKDVELLHAAVITSVRLGIPDRIQNMMIHYADLQDKIFKAVVTLNWLNYADPKEFQHRMRDVRIMKGQVARIEVAFPVACREHPKKVLAILNSAQKPEELDVFYPHLKAIVEAVEIKEVVNLAEHPSTVISLQAMRLLVKCGKAGVVDAVAKKAEELQRNNDPGLRERAIRLARLLPMEARQQIIRKGLIDQSYRCVEAALDCSLFLPELTRRDALTAFLKTEQPVRLRDTARWLMANKDARAALP